MIQANVNISPSLPLASTIAKWTEKTQTLYTQKDVEAAKNALFH